MATEYKKIITRKGTQAEFNTLQSSTAPLLEAELGWITDENELVIGTGAGQSVSINKNFGGNGSAVTVSRSDHTHDDRYYTESEMDTFLAGKSDSGHNHDTRYYTETEVDNFLANKEPANANIQTHIGTTSGNPHSVTATDVNLGNVTNESKATMFTNPTFTGTVTLPATGTGATEAARKDYVDTEVATKQDTLVAGTNYKTVNGVDIFDMNSNNSSGDAFLRRTVERTLLGSASTNNLRTTITFNIGNNYSVISGSPYSTNITSSSVIIYQEGQPNNNTAGSIGYVLFDITNGDIYRCTSASPSTNYYTWQFEEGITAYSSFNISELNVNTIYRFSGNNLVSDWQIPLSGGANIATQGTLETADPNVLPITSNGLRNTYNYQILIRYVYEDYATGLHYSQYQTVHTPDLGGNDINDIVYFKAPNNISNNITTIEAYTLNGATLNIKFGTPAQSNDVQKVYIYGLS